MGMDKTLKNLSDAYVNNIKSAIHGVVHVLLNDLNINLNECLKREKRYTHVDALPTSLKNIMLN